MSIKLIGDAVHDSDMEHYIAEKYKFGNDPIDVGDVVEFLDFKSEGRYPNITYQPYIHTCKVMPHAQIEIHARDQEYWGEGVKYYPRNEDEFEVKWEEGGKTHTHLNAKKKYLRLPRNTLEQVYKTQQKTQPDPVKQEERIADLERRVLELEQQLTKTAFISDLETRVLELEQKFAKPTFNTDLESRVLKTSSMIIEQKRELAAMNRQL